MSNEIPGLIRRIFSALRYYADRRSKHRGKANSGKRNEKKHTARRYNRTEAAPRGMVARYQAQGPQAGAKDNQTRNDPA